MAPAPPSQARALAKAMIHFRQDHPSQGLEERFTQIPGLVPHLQDGQARIQFIRQPTDVILTDHAVRTRF